MLILFPQLDVRSLKGRAMFSYVSIISVPKNKVMDQIVDGLKDYNEY